jgi:hypothetical protein
MAAKTLRSFARPDRRAVDREVVPATIAPQNRDREYPKRSGALPSCALALTPEPFDMIASAPPAREPSGRRWPWRGQLNRTSG